MRHTDMVMDSMWQEEEEWKEMFKDIDNFVCDIRKKCEIFNQLEDDKVVLRRFINQNAQIHL